MINTETRFPVAATATVTATTSGAYRVKLTVRGEIVCDEPGHPITGFGIRPAGAIRDAIGQAQVEGVHVTRVRVERFDGECEREMLGRVLVAATGEWAGYEHGRA